MRGKKGWVGDISLPGKMASVTIQRAVWTDLLVILWDDNSRSLQSSVPKYLHHLQQESRRMIVDSFFQLHNISFAHLQQQRYFRGNMVEDVLRKISRSHSLHAFTRSTAMPIILAFDDVYIKNVP